MRPNPRHDYLASVVFALLISACAGTPRSFKETTLDDLYPILTGEQYDSLSSLESSADILDFLDNYWVSVDPTPDTRENEFQAEYLQRLRYTNEHFPDARGWGRSDRKGIYLEYGPPTHIERSEYTDVQISTFTSIKSLEIWLYMTPGKSNYFSSWGDRLYPGVKKFIFADITGTGVLKLLYSSEEGSAIDSRLLNEK